MRLRRIRVAGLLIGATALLGWTPIASAAPIAPLWIPALAHSEDLTGPILARGQLFDRSGRPARGTVYAVAWPTQDVLHSLKDGDKVKTLAIAQGAANGSGIFNLRVDPAVPLSEYTEADGTINLDIRAGGADGLALWAVSRRLSQSAKAGQWLQPANEKAADRVPGAISLVLGQAGGKALDGKAGVPLPAADKASGCDQELATYSNVTTAIGETYPGPHAKATFQYTNGQKSSLGVGASISGSAGSWSQSGTSSSSGATTLGFPEKTYNTKFIYETHFQYKKYHVWDPVFCVFDYGYEVRTTAFQGAVLGYDACCAPSTPYSQPISVVPATITKDSSSAVNWSDGVKISFVIGINISSQTGYSNTAKVKFVFTSAGSLRGNDSRGYVYSSRVTGG